MYNEEQKKKFIEEFSDGEKRKHAAETMFNTLEKYEQKLNADICTMSKEDLQPVVDDIIGIRNSSKRLRFALLKNYIKWCLENNVDGACNAITQVESSGINKMRRQMVANPRHLQRYLDVVYDPVNLNTIDCVYRCYYWLAYMGVNEQDVLNIKISDVDLTDMVLRFNGKDYEFYIESIPVFKKCVSLTRFQLINPIYDPDIEVFRDRVCGDRLLRGLSENQSIYSLRSMISRRSKSPKYKLSASDGNLDLELSFYRVWLSGLFYRMYEAERAGMPVMFRDVAMEQYATKNPNANPLSRAGELRVREITSGYNTDYKRWKEAFSI